MSKSLWHRHEVIGRFLFPMRMAASVVPSDGHRQSRWIAPGRWQPVDAQKNVSATKPFVHDGSGPECSRGSSQHEHIMVKRLCFAAAVLVSGSTITAAPELPPNEVVPTVLETPWIRYQILASQNHPFSVIYISYQRFKVPAFAEFFVTLPRSKFKIVAKMTRARVRQPDCLSELHGTMQGVQILQHEKEGTRKCILPPELACEHMSRVLKTGVGWAAEDLTTIQSFMGEAGCDLPTALARPILTQEQKSRIDRVSCALSGSMFVFRGVRNRSFARSVHGRIHSVPENKCDPISTQTQLITLWTTGSQSSKRHRDSVSCARDAFLTTARERRKLEMENSPRDLC
jgi:hypothetical protein